MKDLHVFLVRPTRELRAEEVDHCIAVVRVFADQAVRFCCVAATQELEGQVVDIPKPAVEQRPTEFEYLAEYDNTVDKETVKRGTPGDLWKWAEASDNTLVVPTK